MTYDKLELIKKTIVTVTNAQQGLTRFQGIMTHLVFQFYVMFMYGLSIMITLERLVVYLRLTYSVNK